MTKRSLLITVDTELSNFPDGQGLWGRVGSECWGLERMLDEFDALSVTATFFLDVYGRHEADVTGQRRAAELIQARGHDLQLHTHPAPVFDPKKPRLRDYSLSEQAEVLCYGLDRVEQWTGHRPTLHRAGDWGADNHSLHAMASLGIQADFSASPWSPNCGIDHPSMQCNGWAHIDGLMCGLGTCFRDRLTGRIRRVDIGGTSFQEIIDVLSRHIDPFILTLHSFSLLRFDRGRTHFKGNALYVRRLRELFCIASREHGYQVKTAAEVVAEMQARSPGDLVATPLPTTTLVTSTIGILKSIRGRLGSLAT